MQAGCQLYSKNPARLPASATARTATSKFSLWIATRVNVPLTSRPTPEASPSMPSIRFQTFMQPRNQNIVTSRLGSASSNGNPSTLKLKRWETQVDVQAEHVDRLDPDAAQVKAAPPAPGPAA